jgi:hypothetical protein
MPSSKITFPVNGGEFPANKAFTFKMAVQNMNLGNFVNAQKVHLIFARFLETSHPFIRTISVLPSKLTTVS